MLNLIKKRRSLAVRYALKLFPVPKSSRLQNVVLLTATHLAYTCDLELQRAREKNRATNATKIACKIASVNRLLDSFFFSRR